MSSILPIYLVVIFTFLISITRRAQVNESISSRESRNIYLLIVLLALWVILLMVLGVKKTHLDLIDKIPFLWQAFIPVTLWVTGLIASRNTRLGLHKISMTTPPHWLAWIQAMRIGAVGGIAKGIEGTINSTYVFWIGIPDFLFGISALFMGWLLWRGAVRPEIVLAWNLLGFGLIFFPTFLIMPYWMNEPGFRFIFEYPMVLAPGVIVSVLISINLMQAWSTWVSSKKLTT